MSAVLMPNPVPSNRRRYSDRSAARWFQIIDVIGKTHEPTVTQLDALASAYSGTGEYLAECDEFKGLVEQVHPHGSRELGTLVRPIDPTREGFDIDLFAQLNAKAMIKYGGADGPARLLADLFLVARRYANAHGLKVVRCDRCVTLEYAGGMTADIAPIISVSSNLGRYPETMGRIPDRHLLMYDITNPLGYAKAFSTAAAISPNFRTSLTFDKAFEARADAVAPLSEAQEVFPRLLSRIVQLLKLHRNNAFGASTGAIDVRPTSIFLTTLAAQAYAAKAPQPHDSPLDLLMSVLEDLPRHIAVRWAPDGTQTWWLDNPSAPGDNLASAMNTPARQQAFSEWIVKAREDVDAILQAIEDRNGMDEVLVKIEHAFGDRAARGVRNDGVQSQQSQRSGGIVKLVSGAAAATISTSARAHTFFGD